MGREGRPLRLLMRPANAVCDAMGMTDENERGVVRMLVNMLLLIVIGVALSTLTIGSLVR